MNEPLDANRLSRREVLRFFAGASAALAAGEGMLPGAEAAAVQAQGYGTDPDVLKLYERGDVWPLTCTETQRKAMTAFADLLLPADELGPAASALRVPDFIDEWISAPYPDQAAHRPVILEGLAWLDAESARRSKGKSFAEAGPERQRAILDDICDPAKAAPEHKPAAAFFRLFRDLAMGAYYCTSEGWKAIGYVGNVALPTFDGPPPEVLAKLRVEQTVRDGG